jgi:L-alanine-DL-glutamate epimerase-like enolase superfamily enzyme
MAPRVSITTTPQRIALDPPQQTPRGTFTAVWAADVEVDVGGRRGSGRGRVIAEDQLAALVASLDELTEAPSVRAALGAVASAPDPLASWRETWLEWERHARPGAPLVALAALDEAVWDLTRRDGRLPPPRGAAPSIGVYWSGLWLHSSADELAAEIGWAAGEGYDGAKMRVDGGAVGPSIDRVRAALAVAPPGRWLALELARSGTPEGVVELVAALDPARILWVEDPLVPEDVSGTAELARLLPVPVAVGEDCWGRAEFDERITATGAQLPIVDLGYLGGPTAMLLLLEDGLAARPEVGVHVDALAGAGVAAIAPGPAHLWLEAYSWWGLPSLPAIHDRARRTA